MKNLLVLLVIAALITVAGCGNKEVDTVNDYNEYTTIDFLCDDTKPVASETKADVAETDATKSTTADSSTASTSSAVSTEKETQKETQKQTEKQTQKETVMTQEQWDAYVEAMQGYVYINDLKGKSVQNAKDKGYYRIGYVTASSGSSIQECRIHMKSTNITAEITDMITKLSAMTVAQLKDEYFGVSIDYKGSAGNYKYTCSIGSVEFEFDLDNGEKALKGHENDFFFDLEDAGEVQNDKLKNVKFVEMTVYGVLDADSSQKLVKMIDSDTTDDEKSMGELTFEKVYYDIK